MAITHTSKFLAATAIVGTALASLSQPVQAQPAYGSYIGVGVAVGQTNSAEDGLDLAGVVAGRYKLLEFPISLRTQVAVDGNSIAFVPTVSYDFPLTWQLEPYVGAGVSFTNADSIVGDKTSFVIQPGVDYSIPNSRIVLFGNAMIAIDAYDGGAKDGETAVSVQTGLGYRF
ncbi:porin family protein [Prochlorothrix hollandica]|uniref:Outer membrane protein beta-barrel domain-containing protein n=1 Tax=Prochlorothrix hollandica PCC 9006 = CALU 1027 TaxID=317619 RepID=A0A0M2PVG3_PROHO|nr:porin family protein [Prochlorothrix hollandica]KKJ00426.1 hypothetical protein PROH_12395 [Prochlorothrix hollandica PCC 9006 = CALU 1027]